ncbi:MAG: helix-turn-helix transcriptional regulator [Erysipelotrichaceae bacterium]|nr:helix-turn-helix transcriptional regulator [Erysipelotrichaceae bacterium]
MIVFSKLKKKMDEKGISTYALMYTYGISSSVLSRLKNNKTVTTETLGKLCHILDCKLSEIAEDNEHPE